MTDAGQAPCSDEAALSAPCLLQCSVDDGAIGRAATMMLEAPHPVLSFETILVKGSTARGQEWSCGQSTGTLQYRFTTPPSSRSIGASCLGPNHDLAGRSVGRKAGITCRPIQSRDTTTTNNHTPPTLHYLELAHDVSRRPSPRTV
ncbi:hypothetical protein NXS19_003100 [Fusarium pseudograminearum]|nr:hypothetical protein NXS19_003100 [Fusarium pseudograminearum]